MKVLRFSYTELPDLPPLACAIGYFDGFHHGHRQLVEKARQLAQKHGISSAVMTFDPDPWYVFKPDADKHHLQSVHDKVVLCQNLGIDYLLIVDFTKEFASLEPAAFHNVLAGLNIRYLVCGFDFTYGFRSTGNVETLKKQYKFEVDVIEPIKHEDEKISSSRIEKLVREGRVEEANDLLDCYYSIAGIIVHGFERGRLLNYPTANLQPEAGYVLPKKGVYAGYVYENGELHACMINIGTNPTFENELMTIEAHIFNYSNDLYGRTVRFFFAFRLRDEKRFSSVQELKEQLDHDAVESQKVLADNTRLLAPTVDLWKIMTPFDILNRKNSGENYAK